MSKVTYEYGKALFELASEDGMINEYLGEIRIISGIFKDNEAFMSVIASPVIPKEERLALIDRIFSDSIELNIRSFMKLLTERGKAKLIPACFEEYERLWYENSGIVIAEVETASVLSENEKNRLHSALEKKTGSAVEMRVIVTPELIGGLRVKVGGELIDGSVKGRLSDIKTKLLNTNH